MTVHGSSGVGPSNPLKRFRRVVRWRGSRWAVFQGIGGADTEVLKFLPGIRFSWDIPGLAFLNLDVTAVQFWINKLGDKDMDEFAVGQSRDR